MKIKRHIAYKVKIKDILEGDYIKDSPSEPSYILIGDKQVSRVNLLGVVVSELINEQSYQSAMIDDGTGKILIRFFEPSPSPLKLGDTILLIGKPREYNNERYIVPEIIKKIDDHRWIEVRKLELELQEIKRKEKETQEDKIQEEEIKEESNSTTKIYNLIKEIDDGDGADAEEVIKRSNLEEAEKIIKNLLEEGEIFEIKPGKLKVLE